MDTQIIERLKGKIGEMIAKINSQKDELETLKQEVLRLKESNEAKDLQISNLYESLGGHKKDMEDLVSQIDEAIR